MNSDARRSVRGPPLECRLAGQLPLAANDPERAGNLVAFEVAVSTSTSRSCGPAPPIGSAAPALATGGNPRVDVPLAAAVQRAGFLSFADDRNLEDAGVSCRPGQPHRDSTEMKAPRELPAIPRWLKVVAVTTLFACLLLLPVWLLLALILGIVASGQKLWLRWSAPGRFRAEHGKAGHDLLLVTSNSPRWQEYIEEHWLPRWSHRAVVLNWSERRLWGLTWKASSAVRLFRAFAGEEHFNPLAIVVPPRGRRVHVVRFYQAFRARVGGDLGPLEAREAELEAWLGQGGAQAPEW